MTHAGLASPAFFWVLATILALLPFYSKAHAQAMRLPVMELVVDSHIVTAEIAATDRSRSYGLMNRPSLPPDTGMLFVFDHAGRYCFWMKNTPLPLSIAFIDDDGIIINLADMQPHSVTSHCPQGPIRYALEMEQGWFQAKGVSAGARVTNLPAS